MLVSISEIDYMHLCASVVKKKFLESKGRKEGDRGREAKKGREGERKGGKERDGMGGAIKTQSSLRRCCCVSWR